MAGLKEHFKGDKDSDGLCCSLSPPRCSCLSLFIRKFKRVRHVGWQSLSRRQPRGWL